MWKTRKSCNSRRLLVVRGKGWRVLLAAGFLLFQPLSLKAQQGKEVPVFRHLDATLAKAIRLRVESLRMLVPENLPPFAFRNRRGALTGYAVAVAQAVCRRGRVRCRFVARPAEELAKALQSGQGDVIVAGPRPLPESWRSLDFTRPYFRALGRFAVRRDAKIRQVDFATLTGRRIAVVRGTVHALWLQRHLAKARISPQPDFAQAAAALKTGRADILFADWMQLAFWLPGKAAEGCCRPLTGIINDRLFAFNHLSMAVRGGRRGLRDFLDRQLDLLQEDGELRILARRFLPLSVSVPASRITAKDRKAKRQP